MTVLFPISTHSRPLRRSLKRGLAREAVARARGGEANHSHLFAALRQAAPNRRALERTVLRLRRMPGIVRAGISGGCLVVVVRNTCTMVTRTEGVELFTEEALIYSRMTIGWNKGSMNSWITRASFSLHALERLVERSGCAMGRDFLGAIDAEAAVLLKHMLDGEIIEHDEDSYLGAKEKGVWAGSVDFTPPEPVWGAVQADARVPTFSARTFLGPDEMKPCVWLRWQDDPRLALVA